MEWNRNYCLILTNRDFLLGMVSKERKKAPKMYRDSVEKAIGQELENPLHNLYGGAILGDQTLVKQALSRLKDGIVQRREVSHRRVLQPTYGSDGIIEAICSDFKVSRQDVLSNFGESRNTAIYLMKRLTGTTNGQIGELFGGISYSAVAKAHQRFSTEFGRNKLFQRTDRDDQKRSVQCQGQAGHF